MQQYVDVGDSHKVYERKVQKKTSLFYKQAQEDSEKFQQSYQKDVNKLAIFDEYPELKEYITHFEERNSRFYHRLDRIMTLEQSIKDFSKGYKKYGIFKLEQGLFYRDWAPEAEQVSIAGEFNEWEKAQYQCTQIGQDWEVNIDQQPQNSKYLIYLKKNGDFSKISCWTRQIIMENNQLFGVLSDGYYEFQNQNVKADISKPIIEIDYQENQVVNVIKNLEGPNTILLRGLISNIEGKVLVYFAPNGDCLKIKQFVDYCHSKNISVLVDFPLELWKDSPLVNWDGSSYHYFQQGIAESHMDFEKWELNRYLLSALAYWMNEFKIDGFNFPNLERIICTQQHIKQDLKYLLLENSNIDGLLFLMFANDLIHQINENATTIGSGVPEEYPCYKKIKEGGIGFDAFNMKFDKI